MFFTTPVLTGGIQRAPRTRPALFLILIYFYFLPTPVAGAGIHHARHARDLAFFYIFFYFFYHTCRGRGDLPRAPRTRPVLLFILFLVLFFSHLSREEGFTTRTADEISVDANAADFVGRRRIHEPENERFRRRVVHRRHEHVAADRDPLGGRACCVPAASEFVLLYQ